MAFSRDGVYWQEVRPRNNLSRSIYKILYNGVHFIIYFMDETIYLSVNGVDWFEGPRFLSGGGVRSYGVDTDRYGFIHSPWSYYYGVFGPPYDITEKFNLPFFPTFNEPAYYIKVED